MTTNAATFQKGNKCTDGSYAERDMTDAEIEMVKDMVRSYENVTITGVHICDKGIEVWLAVNYMSRAKYPNNHREYQEHRSFEKAEWRGWF